MGDVFVPFTFFTFVFSCSLFFHCIYTLSSSFLLSFSVHFPSAVCVLSFLEFPISVGFVHVYFFQFCSVPYPIHSFHPTSLHLCLPSYRCSLLSQLFFSHIFVNFDVLYLYDHFSLNLFPLFQLHSFPHFSLHTHFSCSPATLIFASSLSFLHTCILLFLEAPTHLLDAPHIFVHTLSFTKDAGGLP